MGNARTIASLYARRRRLTLGLQDFERRADVYRSTIAEIEETLRTLVPVVPEFKPRRRCQYFTSHDLVRGYYDALREAEGEDLTADDIVTFLMRRKGLDFSDATLRKTVRRRVLAALRRMRRHVAAYVAARARCQ